MLEKGGTVFAFRSDGVIRIIRKLDAASQLARALEACLPVVAAGVADPRAEEEAVRALASWEEARR